MKIGLGFVQWARYCRASCSHDHQKHVNSRCWGCYSSDSSALMRHVLKHGLGLQQGKYFEAVCIGTLSGFSGHWVLVLWRSAVVRPPWDSSEPLRFCPPPLCSGQTFFLRRNRRKRTSASGSLIFTEPAAWLVVPR